mmetsp:Transcript_67148/g.216621  ORF Transcript_67148/g.216621 Transcript_67148/m.216621 type:complete len:214 (-) Transcript_67148:237-878(-)
MLGLITSGAEGASAPHGGSASTAVTSLGEIAVPASHLPQLRSQPDLELLFADLPILVGIHGSEDIQSGAGKLLDGLAVAFADRSHVPEPVPQLRGGDDGVPILVEGPEGLLGILEPVLEDALQLGKGIKLLRLARSLLAVLLPFLELLRQVILEFLEGQLPIAIGVHLPKEGLTGSSHHGHGLSVPSYALSSILQCCKPLLSGDEVVPIPVQV